MVYMTSLSISILALMAALAFVVFQIKLLHTQIKINRKRLKPLGRYGIGAPQTPTPTSSTSIQKVHPGKQDLQKIGGSACSTSTSRIGVSVMRRCKMAMIWLVLIGNELLLWVIIPILVVVSGCLLYTSPSPRDRTRSRMPSSA